MATKHTKNEDKHKLMQQGTPACPLNIDTTDFF
jgi:hypothetical protein